MCISRQPSNFKLVLATVLLGSLTGCAGTSHTDIQTVEGPITNGIVSRPLVVLGLVKLATRSGNLTQFQGTHEIQATVDIPVGTAVIVPAVDGWLLGYGSAQARSDDAFDWTTEDHNYGIGFVDVTVTKINPPNTISQPPTQTAELVISFALSDDNQDDPWFGGVGYTLLCLGVPDRPLSAWQPMQFEPPQFMIRR
jgi:hypothetical protein